jgi:CubicO group peptidase (beta-lactamase class C family)
MSIHRGAITLPDTTQPGDRRPRRHRTIGCLGATALTIVAGCGDSAPKATDTPAVASTTVPAEASTDAPATTAALPATTSLSPTVPATEPPKSPPTTADESAVQPTDDDLSAQIEAVLTDAIAPGSIGWDANGVDLPPTAAVAAVRIPGRDDVLVAVGENVDGSPAEADAPFAVATLTESLVRTVAFQLVDEGALDPTLTVDQWAPTMPNADHVTVQMLLDDATGWGDYGPLDPDPVVSDLGRVWSLREAVDLRATMMTVLGEPGTLTNDAGNNEMVLGLIVETVGAQPLADLIRDRVSIPAGLDDTELLNGSTTPDGYRDGVFPFNGTPVFTSDFDGTSFFTWNQATTSTASTPTDLLDLLEVWETGELFSSDRSPAPDRYSPERGVNAALDYHVGVGVPFNGYCPCTQVDGGIEPTAFGRVPGSLGTLSFILHHTSGISVVLNVNSDEVADLADLAAVVQAVHDLAAAAG